ncbi:MAG TPA: IS1595 family transposase [Verrucomicrobiae bacterium]|nr:IS1595 family transposase [Verrucomicrobiae bacterium]
MKTTEQKDELNLVTLAQEYADEDKARELLESILWPDGAVCPHCKNHKEKAIYKLQSKPESKTQLRKGLYKCGACRKQFTVTVGTIFEDSHIPISKWLMALFILCSSKKSISALQLSRMLKIGYQAAWFMAHRLRFAFIDDDCRKLKGVVEIDETFIGGKGDMKTKLSRKTPVMALIEQGGNMKARVVPNVSYKNLGKVLREEVQSDAVICSDENTAYQQVGNEFKAHYTVTHSKYEYLLRTTDGISAGTNHCESFFSLLKRGVNGAWHNVSREHLHRYVNEFAFRWNTRHQTDGERMETALGLTTGKRLTYQQVI